MNEGRKEKEKSLLAEMEQQKKVTPTHISSQAKTLVLIQTFLPVGAERPYTERLVHRREIRPLIIRN
jgi:hypothetical protein